MFDLDGTLADTLADIAAAGNHVMQHFGRQPIPVPRYRTLAGQGARWLVEHALHSDDQTMIEEGVRLLKAFQLEHAHARTTLYPGIAELLDALAARRVPMAVLSNKPDAATVQLVSHLLGRWRFAAVRGHREGTPLKPDPASAIAIADELNILPSRWLYVGDTDVDMLTATGAGMFAAGVLWGFRDEDELRRSGAKAIVSEPVELLALL
jgi:phosphoglycolate phosphatase